MAADFMTAAGPLYHWPADRTPTPDGPVPADELTIRTGISPALDHGRYQDLWFHLAAYDRRITRAWADGIDPVQGLCALHDPGLGTAWIQRDGSILHTGLSGLSGELTHLVTAWHRQSQPVLGQWHCHLPSTGPANTPLHIPTSWQPTTGL